MKRSRFIYTPKAGSHSLSRRDLLSRGAQVLSVVALPALLRPTAWGQTTPTFDYYISPEGSDSNAGTQASPWGISSLQDTNANNSKMAGKRVGLLSGTYNVAGMHSGSQPSDYQHPVLHIPSGSSSAPTVIQSVTPQGAIFTFAGNTGVNAVFGQNPGSGGYFTLDGVVINGGGYGGCLVYASYNTSIYTGPGVAPGITIRNCEIYGIAATDVGANEACIFLQGALNAVISNNKLHDVTKPAQADHAHGYEEYACTATQFIYNTVYNCPTALDAKAGCSGTVVAYNYFYNCPVGAIQGFDGAEGNPNNPNTAYSIHNNVIDSCGGQHVTDVNDTTAQAISWYNNTCYDTRSGSVCTLDLRASGSRLIQCYNNICVATANGSGPYMGTIAQSLGGYSLLDYNDYYLNSYSSAWGLLGAATSVLNSLGLWQAASGADAHSTVGNPQFAASIVPGAGANQFKLGGSSPCKGTGRTNGSSSGAACDMGAWGGAVVPTQIGCNFAAGVTTPAPVPNAPTLSVS
jgi:hypothetical protein